MRLCVNPQAKQEPAKAEEPLDAAKAERAQRAAAKAKAEQEAIEAWRAASAAGSKVSTALLELDTSQ